MENCDCPVCGGEGFVLGGLGRLVWFRCRDCGLDFNRADEPVVHELVETRTNAVAREFLDAGYEP